MTYDWIDLWQRKAGAESALSASGRGSTDTTTFLHIVADVLAVMDPVRSDEVLDLGCGPGMFSIVLAPLVTRVHAMDLVPKMVDLAEVNLRPYPNATTSVGSLTETGQPASSFDKILVNSVLQYLPSAEDAAGAFRELGRILLPGGTVFLAANPDPALRHIRQAQIDENPNVAARELENQLIDEILWISRQDIVAMAAAAGLDATVRPETSMTKQRGYMYGVVAHKPLEGGHD